MEKYLTGDSEPSELIYFKLYRSQVPVIEQALETAAGRPDAGLGSLARLLFCADFLAGANLENGDPGLLLFSIRRFYRFLSAEQQHRFLQELAADESASPQARPPARPCRLPEAG